RRLVEALIRLVVSIQDGPAELLRNALFHRPVIARARESVIHHCSCREKTLQRPQRSGGYCIQYPLDPSESKHEVRVCYQVNFEKLRTNSPRGAAYGALN